MKLSDHFFAIEAVLLVLLFFVLLFTRERHNKVEFLKRVGGLLIIGLSCAMLALPIFGPVFGSTAILLNSIVLGTLVEFK